MTMMCHFKAIQQDTESRTIRIMYNGQPSARLHRAPKAAFAVATGVPTASIIR